MMRVLLCLMLVLSGGVTFADCDPSIQSVPPLGRLGLHVPPHNFCNWDVDVNLNWALLDAQACTIDHPCLANGFQPFTVENLVSTDDNYDFFMPGKLVTLVSVACHCDANCTTPATLSFWDRQSTAIPLTGGGYLTCSATAGPLTPTTFSTSDSARIISAWAGVQFSTTNTPTTGQKITFTLLYTYTP